MRTLHAGMAVRSAGGCAFTRQPTQTDSVCQHVQRRSQPSQVIVAFCVPNGMRFCREPVFRNWIFQFFDAEQSTRFAECTRRDNMCVLILRSHTSPRDQYVKVCGVFACCCGVATQREPRDIMQKKNQSVCSSSILRWPARQCDCTENAIVCVGVRGGHAWPPRNTLTRFALEYEQPHCCERTHAAV